MTFRPAELVIAGWTGRDETALTKHIRELEVSGPDTSGEVEFALLKTDSELRIAVGSEPQAGVARVLALRRGEAALGAAHAAIVGGRRALPGSWAMFCGTLAANGGLRPAATFTMELDDPVLGRKLRHEYRIKVLPVE
jgi:hypothetical protein